MKRIYHTWDEWECYPAGFYEDKPKDGMSVAEGEELYREFLSTPARFEKALRGLIKEWKNSCEHYLTNENMNRIAWLGQAAMAYAHGVPSCCRGGFNRLTEQQQIAANEMALKYLNKWLVAHKWPALTLEQAKSKTEADMY